MFTSITFFVSLVGIVFLFWNKKRELEGGRAFVDISHVNEHSFKTKMKDVGQSAKEMPKKMANVAAFLAVKQGVKTFEKVKEVVYPKISHIVDAVKGRDIPKNRGSVSLFLKHIEDYRETK
ncbi:MAG: hypothetical protein JWP09_59 [Candidatus Taylorbacteria bacterium]|nr:hypothetical protein [Candidatus Taylorbacteria bacterium]